MEQQGPRAGAVSGGLAPPQELVLSPGEQHSAPCFPKTLEPAGLQQAALLPWAEGWGDRGWLAVPVAVIPWVLALGSPPLAAKYFVVRQGLSTDPPSSILEHSLHLQGREGIYPFI